MNMSMCWKKRRGCWICVRHFGNRKQTIEKETDSKDNSIAEIGL